MGSKCAPIQIVMVMLYLTLGLGTNFVRITKTILKSRSQTWFIHYMDRG